MKPPFSRFGMPHANSTFSSPRCTSPIASESTLPCCAVIAAASVAFRSSSSSRIWNITSDRFESDVARHAGNASAAAATAMADLIRAGEVHLVRLLAGRGVVDRPLRPDSPGTTFPPIQWLIRSIVSSSRPLAAPRP